MFFVPFLICFVYLELSFSLYAFLLLGEALFFFFSGLLSSISKLDASGVFSASQKRVNNFFNQDAPYVKNKTSYSEDFSFFSEKLEFTQGRTKLRLKLNWENKTLILNSMNYSSVLIDLFSSLKEFKGNLLIPRNLFFVCEKVYFKQKATLLDLIKFPKLSLEDEEYLKIQHLLIDFDLEYLLPLMNKEEKWEEILSGGEKQRINLIRVFSKFEPSTYYIFEKITSALNSTLEKKIYTYIQQNIPKYISFGTSSLEKFHKTTLDLKNFFF